MKEIDKIIKELKNTKIKGIIRRIDELGRIVIPADYRKGKIEEEKTNVAISKVQDYVVLEILKEEQENSKKN